MSLSIVGIGASAGGLEAMVELLSHLPGDTGFAFLMVQHLDATHSSLLSEILGKHTTMPVKEATQDALIEPNQVYVIPPNASMTVAHDRLVLRPRRLLGPPMPIDDLFESLADRDANAIGVILSGSGSDGALGIQAIKAEGGTTFAQDLDSARFASMPRAAIEQGHIDFILRPRQIAEQISRISRWTHNTAPDTTSAKPVLADEENLKRIFRRLRNTCNVDFTHYKRGTVTRRLARRLALHELESPSEYVQFLDDNPGEAQAFCKDLLIRVTGFFRDPETFEALLHTVLPRLMENRAPQTPLRIWVPGCASGEEVYSIAICVAEYLGERIVETPIQIFGTDINDSAIDAARAGRFIENIERDVSEERLRRFFVKTDSHYRVTETIRDLCIFSRQDITRDPPFSHIDLVSCRNLLIYLDAELQKRVIPIFHYALKPNGLLMLGASESIGHFSELFRTLDGKDLKIYQKKNLPGRTPLDLRGSHGAHRSYDRPTETKEAAASEIEQLQLAADRIALNRYAPAGVLCDEELNIVQFRGDTSAFLAHASGTASLNLQKLVRPDLLVHIGSAIQQARRDGVPIRKTDLRIGTQDGVQTMDLEIIPLQESADAGQCFLITFDHRPRTISRRTTMLSFDPWTWLKSAWNPKRNAGTTQSVQSSGNEILRLTRELETSREYIRRTIEEHESTNEELKSAQEELLSSNEEFQSTNEELETAKEELQSTNEELITTNDELRHRNRELHELNNHLVQTRDYADAIVETVRHPLVVLDADLRVVRANRAFYSAFKSTPQNAEHGLFYEIGNRQWDIPELRRLLEETLPHSASFDDYEVTSFFPDIGLKTMRLNARRLSWAGRALILLVIEDTTERKAAMDVLQQNERRRNEFLAMLAHELRNPLAAIRNALEIWRHGSADKDTQKQAQAMLDRQLRKETRLIDDLLDVSRITRGIITLGSEPVDMGQVVNQAVEETRVLFEARGHRLKLALPVEPIIVQGDATRLEQVVANLLGNSIKFTEPNGAINITLERQKNTTVLTVADNGIGIAPELLSKVFELFVQAECSKDRAQGGLGLGLTLVHRLVELHGGTVEAKSGGLKQGSEFIVRLPALRMSQQIRNAMKTKPSKILPIVPHRILVIDDNADTADSAAVLLRLYGHDVRVAPDGESGLAIAQTFKPETVLLDIGLPRLDGYQIARRFRKLPDALRVLLIAVSGYGGLEDRRRSMEAGFDEHLVKPVDPNKINEVIANNSKRNRTIQETT